MKPTTLPARSLGSGLLLLARGALAGVAGTLAMDWLWFRRYRSGGGSDSFPEWELSAGVTGFDDAGAPAQVGRKLARGVDIDIPPEHAGLTNDIVHWSTGAGWGTGCGLLVATTRLGPATAGGLVGLVAFGTAYTILPRLGVYDPIWEYDRQTLWEDLSAHLLFGVSTGAVLGVLRAR